MFFVFRDIGTVIVRNKTLPAFIRTATAAFKGYYRWFGRTDPQRRATRQVHAARRTVSPQRAMVSPAGPRPRGKSNRRHGRRAWMVGTAGKTPQALRGDGSRRSVREAVTYFRLTGLADELVSSNTMCVARFSCRASHAQPGGSDLPHEGRSGAPAIPRCDRTRADMDLMPSHTCRRGETAERRSGAGVPAMPGSPS